MNTNTTILKWDVTVQKGIILLNTLCIIAGIFSSPFFLLVLALQFFSGLYQLISSAVHLRFPHRSIGYRQYRTLHFWGGLAYVCLLGFIWSHDPGKPLLIITALIIPQCILYSYFALCYYELKYLEHLEFHILR